MMLSKIFRVKQIKISYDKNLQLDFHKLLSSIDKNKSNYDR